MYTIFLFLVLIIIATAALAGISFAPWVPAWKKDLPRIMRLADLQPGQTFYELGCGDGKVVFYAARNFDAQVIGLEISLILFGICKLKQLFYKNKNLAIKYKNLFKQNLRDADVVYFFGMPDKISQKLRKKLDAELRPGTKVISYAFEVSGWSPVAVDKPRPNDVSIYLYIKG